MGVLAEWSGSRRIMRTPVFESVSVASVRKADVIAALASRGISHVAASHIAATASLARRIRELGQMSIDIATVIDLVVMLSLDRESADAARAFPSISSYSADSPAEYETALSGWRAQARGSRIAAQISFSNAVREAARQEQSTTNRVTRLFDGAAREFGKTVQALIASGIAPADVLPSDEVGILAQKIWDRMERDGRIPRFTAVRDIFWISPVKLSDSTDIDRVNVRSLISEVLKLIFGESEVLHTIVYHGFYFYTPVQWRFFLTTRLAEIADQLFIVHDDGSSGVFETWRRFFADPLMPTPIPVNGLAEPSPQAHALNRALAGEHVDAVELDGLLTICECKTPSDFIATLTRYRLGPAELGQSRLHLFAPDTDTVDRLLGRFSGVMADGTTDLAQLPIGAFLLALHDCLVVTDGWDVHTEFNEQRLVAIFSSGMLEVDGRVPDPVSLVSILRRTIPFFRGCREAVEWVHRADRLRNVVRNEVAPLGERRQGVSDIERIQSAVRNPLRLVPWADITIEESEVLYASLQSLAELVQEISAKERQSINEHLSRLKPRLQRGMRNLPEGQRRQVERTVESLGSSITEDLYVASLVEMVRLLLGREVDFGFSGEQDDRDGAVLPLRALDALGYAHSEDAVHVANLADGSFPFRVQTVGWPFRLEDLADTAPEVSLQLLNLRSDTSPLSDLYLLWLALDGAKPGGTVVLSWIVRMANELRNPSPIVKLLTKPCHDGLHESIVARLGGVPVVAASMARVEMEADIVVGPKQRETSPVDVASLLTKIDVKAAACALMCQRRFAIQWVMGQTAAFSAAHHQQMLYGNVRGRMELRRIPDFERICSELWCHLTEGERTSSKENSVVRPSGAKPEFTLTLGGKRRGNRPVDRAYEAAINNQYPSREVIVPEDLIVLPSRPNAIPQEVCELCPVGDRCMKRIVA